MARTEERATAISNELIFVELEWAALPDEQVEPLLAADGLEFCRHYLVGGPALPVAPADRTRGADPRRQGRDRAERLVAVVQRADLRDPARPRRGRHLARGGIVEVDGRRPRRPEGGRRGGHRRASRRACARVRSCSTPCWPTRPPTTDCATTTTGARAATSTTRRVTSPSRRSSTRSRTGTTFPQRWYALKAQLLGLDRLADYDRMASIASVEEEFGWSHARELVLDAYASFSPELAEIAQRFFDEDWIDAPIRPGKRPGAFCAYTVPSHHPYLLLNWTSRRRDVLTLAHELGHGLHAYLAREQGVFHQTTPLTLAETASVFGETVTFGRLLARDDRPGGPARARRREPRRSDRHGVPPDGDVPVRGRRAQRTPLARAS